MRTHVIVTALVFVGLAGCDGQSVGVGEQGPLPDGTGIPDDAVATEFEVIYTAQVSGVIDARRAVIRDAEAWGDFWAEATSILAPAPDVPSVDFDQDMVIVAAMGQRATGGYAITVDEVMVSDIGLFAVVRETSPSARCIVTQALTAPVTAVRVTRSDTPVSFEEEEEELDCG